jgi:hypothetical protein
VLVKLSSSSVFVGPHVAGRTLLMSTPRGLSKGRNKVSVPIAVWCIVVAGWTFLSGAAMRACHGNAHPA